MTSEKENIPSASNTNQSCADTRTSSTTANAGFSLLASTVSGNSNPFALSEKDNLNFPAAASQKADNDSDLNRASTLAGTQYSASILT